MSQQPIRIQIGELFVDEDEPADLDNAIGPELRRLLGGADHGANEGRSGLAAEIAAAIHAQLPTTERAG